jgi:transcription elongation factor Elf1
MIKFKGCPKCRGDFYLSGDQYGKYFTCMQCGYHQDVVETKIDANAGLKIKSAPAKRLNKEMEAA